jgi:hypothetical protein
MTGAPFLGNRMRDWRDKLRTTLPALVGLVLFGAALIVLRRRL